MFFKWPEYHSKFYFTNRVDEHLMKILETLASGSNGLLYYAAEGR
jgi:hypothetical protein